MKRLMFFPCAAMSVIFFGAAVRTYEVVWRSGLRIDLSDWLMAGGFMSAFVICSLGILGLGIAYALGME